MSRLKVFSVLDHPSCDAIAQWVIDIRRSNLFGDLRAKPEKNCNKT